MTDRSTGPNGSLRDKLAVANARPKPKRFYKVAAVEPIADGWRLVLDGRSAKTPRRRDVSVASEPVAHRLAAEWNGQVEVIDPATMPVTTLVCTTIDTVADARDAVIDEIVAYAGSDLLCHRADAPEGLVAQQARRWQPVLDWAAREFGIVLATAEGVMPLRQDAAMLERVRDVVVPFTPLEVAALHVLTTLTGSALLGLAVAHRALTFDEAWSAAHVDEDWQIAQWGQDQEAAERRARRRRDAAAAAFVLVEA